MTFNRIARVVSLGGLVVLVAACGNREAADRQREELAANEPYRSDVVGGQRREGNIWTLFRNNDDPNTRIAVNRYIWTAALDVLSFLPVQTVDPFSGVFTTGYGTPPGGGRAYRATVYVQDAALDARSLHVALQTNGGATVSAETTRAIEDAILTRARQLRLADGKR
ncbi:DUF3576 domain-containing protein [Falsirhodobacter sp. 20TX0035]|uniref:DUF3576 domain-containing protein n=1 Tax=Falsirhodobacter sp. 20TX0035 TaxID=3022019 RepID=UPI00232E5E87|nr:DUF3576 domain-containing protein [Falsirhodobacter sp. 20TX0035]MDB6452534.1 DUF3576 domain-containing protein [Falsirhodobacter sp. 20TX0035]